MAVFTALAVTVAPPTANAAPDDGDDHQSIKICKKVDGGDDGTFEFHVKGDDYDATLQLEDDECKKLTVETGVYSISEEKQPGWRLKDLRVNHADWYLVDKDERRTELRVDKHDKVEVTVVNVEND